jgi:hypothetical protein
MVWQPVDIHWLPHSLNTTTLITKGCKMSTQLFNGDFDEDGMGSDPGVLFDPTGLRAGNYFPNEISTTTLSPVVFSKNGPFYSGGLMVKGTLKTDVSPTPTLITLELGVDYIYSPQFNIIKQLLGLDAYSYIILIDKSKWMSIHLSYHAVGAIVDQVLMAEIGRLGVFDQNDLTVWASLVGDAEAFNKLNIDDLLSQTSNVYILSRELELISKNLDTPAEWLEYIKQEFNGMVTTISGLQAQIDSLKAMLLQAATPIDLSPYLLKSDMPTQSEAEAGLSILPRAWSSKRVYDAILKNGVLSSSINVVTTDVSLESFIAGGTVLCQQINAISIRVPDVVAMSGKRTEYVNEGVGPVTIYGDPIVIGANVLSGIPLLPGDNITLLSDGVKYHAISGSGALHYSDSFKSGTGYSRTPEGTITQRGNFITGSNGKLHITFPIMFPQAVESIVATHIGGGGAICFVDVTTGEVTLAGFNVATSVLFNAVSPNPLNGYWVAIGN